METKKIESVAIEVKFETGKKDEAIEEKFMELMDENGGVLAANPSCGGNVYFDSIEKFPKTNQRCTCGQRGHYMVKFSAK